MARQNDRQRVAAVRGTDRACGLDIADRECKFAIAPGGTKVDLPQCVPDFGLKFGTDWRQGQIKLTALAVEIFLKLHAGKG